MNDSHHIDSLDALLQHYPAPRATSRSKIQSSLSEPMREWLNHAPFFVMASVGSAGVDCSPRGDLAGQAFRVMDSGTIAIPDRRGNNRIDTLRNIVNEPRVGLVFFVPGIDEALRIKGHASISVDPQLLDEFLLDDIPPATVIVIKIHSAYVQNARAMRSSDLWNPENKKTSQDLPSAAKLSSTAHGE